MLRFLLDEHLSPAIADGLHRTNKSIGISSLTDWENGRFLGLPDDLILGEAAAQGLTLVTYDRKTIPPLLKTWAEIGRDHGGIVFVDDKTISPSNLGAPILAMQKLFQQTSRLDWTNRICFLRR